MPPVASYVFADEWRVAADLEIVWTVLRRLEEWPDWWPSVRSLTLLDPGTEKGEGAVWRFVFQTRLPYKMNFDAEFVRVDPLVAVEARVHGRVEGSGLWSLSEIAGGTLVRFDWLVTPQVGWMRALAPLARGIFNWNHRALMSEGAEALGQRLGVCLLAPPLSAAA
jgi:Polyketide cyclase / dehydrase and lipid transport